MKFEYTISPGVSLFRSQHSQFSLARRIDKTAPFTVDTGIKRLPGHTALLSLVVRPEKLATRRQWHTIRATEPNAVVQKLAETVKTRHKADEARLLMSQFALYIASNPTVDTLADQTIDTFVALLPEYEKAVPTRQLVHKEGFGAAQALLQRSNVRIFAE